MPSTTEPNAPSKPSPFEPLVAPLRTMTYSEARDQIQDGDLLLWRGKYMLSRFFEFFSRNWFSHAAIAMRWNGHLMLMQAEFPYIEAVPLWKTVRRYDGDVFWYTFTPEYRARVDLPSVFKEGHKHLGQKFNAIDVFVALAHRYFGRPLPTDPKKKDSMFCSEYVSRCFRAGHAPLTDDQDIDTFPSDIAKSPYVVFKATLRADPGDGPPPPA